MNGVGFLEAQSEKKFRPILKCWLGTGRLTGRIPESIVTLPATLTSIPPKKGSGCD